MVITAYNIANTSEHQENIAPSIGDVNKTINKLSSIIDKFRKSSHLRIYKITVFRSSNSKYLLPA